MATRGSIVRWIFILLGAGGVALAIAYSIDRYELAKTPPPMGFIGVAGGIPPALAAPGTGVSSPEDLFKIYSHLPPIEPAQYRSEELPRIFDEFQHQPFEHAGFDEVMLPFVYSDPDHVGDANEGLALDELMSFDLDWSPGCYCARHATFEFNRDPAHVQALQQGYSPEAIASLIRAWKATHAVGGELIRTKAGYRGRLEIFTPDGKEVFTRSFDGSSTFWDLLGDMDVAAMTFLDVAPSQRLGAYLHEQRCKEPQSLIDLGSIAFVQQFSAEEFAICQKILTADPEFAIVRQWHANQMHLRDGDNRQFNLQTGMALSSRVEPASLEQFTLSECPDPDVAAEYPQWLNHAADIATEDSPIVLEGRLRNNCYGSENASATIDRGTKVAAKYPNAYSLIYQLGRQTVNPWMSASLLSCGLLNLYQPGNGKKMNELIGIAHASDEVGRDDITMELLSEAGPTQPQASLYELVESLCRGGRYSEATDLYQELKRPLDPTLSKWMAPCAAFAAVVTGKKQLLDQILQEQHEDLAMQNLDGVFGAYREALAGKAIDPHTFLTLHRSLDYWQIWNLLLVAYCDARAGASTYHRLMTECTYIFPLDRLVLIAQDDYQRRDPSRDAGAFYDYLGWLHADDAWAVKAAADFRQRAGQDPPIDVAILLDDLQQSLRNGPYNGEMGSMDWNHVLTPWRVAACVHQLLQQNRVKDAVEIATMYRDSESTDRNYRLDVANELLDKVRQWKPTN